jgi:aspartate/methionine/tyrosine aminotransferase
MFRINPSIGQVETPPIAEAESWLNKAPRNRALINLCQAVPSYPPALEMQAEIARLALLPETGLYTDILGLPELRVALATHMADAYAAPIAAENIAITAGCNQAYCLALMALAGPGDNVILPSPYYFNHHMWLNMLNIEPRSFPAFTEQSSMPRPNDAVPLIDERTRAIVLCSPNNPSGATYSPDLIAAFHELARERGVALVLDETYKDFRGEAGPPHQLFHNGNWHDTFIQLYSFSKAYAMTGYRVGSVTAGRPLIAQIEKIIDCIAICAPRPSQHAALFGLRHLSDWKNDKAHLMTRRLEALYKAFADPALKYKLISAGAFFAYIRHPFRGHEAKAVAQMLAREHELLCLPGSMFGPGQEDYLRLAFANVDASLMPQVVERLIESQN